jgi:hypothetical protein
MAHTNTHPAPFEMSYLRDRALKVATLQRQGQILASGSPPERGQGFPLPYIHDIPGLRRGQYPYEYECEWGCFRHEYDLGVYRFLPNDGKVPPDWEDFDLRTPIQPVSAVIDRSRRLATVKAGDQEMVFTDVPVGESFYNLLYQVNAAIAKSHQPFVVWRLEWVAGEAGRLWPDRVPQIKNENGSAYVTGYAHDEAGNLVYLGMVGHKTVLDSIRATVQARQRKKLFLQGKPVYPLKGHYCQAWQHLPDYGAYHAVLIADSALPGKWQTEEDVAFILVLEEDVSQGNTPEMFASKMLPNRLSEALPIPVLHEWAKILWRVGMKQMLIGELLVGGSCKGGYWLHIQENCWSDIVSELLREHKIRISNSL